MAWGRRLSTARDRKCGSTRVGGSDRQIRRGATSETSWGGLRAISGLIPCCRENPLASCQGDRTGNRHRWARRISTGARENSREGTRQNNPVTSGEGVPHYGVEPEGVAENWVKRLFTKNTGLCQLARGGIGSDACPVPEG